MFSDPNVLYPSLQLGILVLFVIAVYRAARTSRERLFEVMSAVVFGLLLEEGDILIFKTYHYSPEWFLIDRVPLAIALCWSLIIFSAMNISDVLGIDERIAPLSDALWATLLDLSLDAVAIRLGLWTWTIPLTAGWFGVPWGNFYAWLGVAASFSVFTRWVRRRAITRGARQALWQGGVPFVAYVGLLVSIVPYAVLNGIYFRRAGVEWILFVIPLGALVVLTLIATMRGGPSRDAPDKFLATVRFLIHFYFLWVLLATGIAVEHPVLLYVSLALIAIELVIAWYVYYASARRAIALG